MQDLSTLSDDDLKALYTQPAAMNTNGLEQLSDDDLKAMYAAPPQTEEKPQNPLLNMNSSFPANMQQEMKGTPLETLSVAGGSALQGAADFVGDQGGFITELLGKVSPKLQAYLNQAGNSLKEGAFNPGLAEAQERNPITTAVGKGSGYTGALFGAGRALPSTGLGGVVSQGALGAGMAGEGNRIIGGLGGAAVPAITSAVTPIGKFLSGNASLGKDIEGIHKTINQAPVSSEFKNMGIKAATNKAYSQFSNTPGKVNTSSTISAVDDFLQNNQAALSKTQTKLIQDLKTDLASAKTLEELHNARKAFTKDYGIFIKGSDKLVGKSRGAAEELKTSVESTLRENAKNLGVLDKYDEANALYKQSLEANIVNQAFKKIETKTGAMDYDAFTNHIKNLKAELRNQLSPETAQLLNGVRNVAKEANMFIGLNTKKQIAGGVGNIPIDLIKAMTKIPGLNGVLRAAGKNKEVARDLGQAVINAGQAKGVAPIISQFLKNEEEE